MYIFLSKPRFKNDIEIKQKLIELTKGNFRDDLCKLKYEEILPQTQIF